MPAIVVASQNPVKVTASLTGFQGMFPQDTWTVRGINVASGVSDQPIGDEETYQGALNRALAAQAQAAATGAHYAIGIEGGCAPEPNNRMSVFAWVVVRDVDGKQGESKTSQFYLPAAVAKLVQQGLELGDADDQIFGQSNSKQQNGSVGLLTHDALTRASYYTQAVILALVPFKNPQFTFPPRNID